MLCTCCQILCLCFVVDHLRAPEQQKNDTSLGTCWKWPRWLHYNIIWVFCFFLRLYKTLPEAQKMLYNCHTGWLCVNLWNAPLITMTVVLSCLFDPYVFFQWVIIWTFKWLVLYICGKSASSGGLGLKKKMSSLRLAVCLCFQSLC